MTVKELEEIYKPLNLPVFYYKEQENDTCHCLLAKRVYPKENAEIERYGMSKKKEFVIAYVK